MKQKKTINNKKNSLEDFSPSIEEKSGKDNDVDNRLNEEP